MKAHAVCLTLLFDKEHLLHTQESQAPYISPVAFGRGALLLPSPGPPDRIDPEHSSPCTCQLRWKHRGFLGKHPQLHGAEVFTSSRLWLLFVRNDIAVCRSAAFRCITRTNEDLITAAWALFVCFCAPVLFLSPVGPPLSRPFLLHTHTCTHTHADTHISQPSEIPACTAQKLFW